MAKVSNLEDQLAKERQQLTKADVDLRTEIENIQSDLSRVDEEKKKLQEDYDDLNRQMEQERGNAAAMAKDLQTEDYLCLIPDSTKAKGNKANR